MGVCTVGNLRFKIDWASLRVGRKFTVFSLLYFVFEGYVQVQAPGGLILEGLVFGILPYIKTRHYKHWQRKALEDQGEDGHYRSVVMVSVLL